MKKQPKTIAKAWQNDLKKEKKKEITPGKKIRSLSIDLSLNLFILLLLSVVFNCIFIISAVMLAYWINIGWVWLLDFIISLLCVIYSICAYVYCVKNYSFTVYDNCLVLNSMWFYNSIVDFKQIKRVETKIGFWDRVFGRGTCTLTLQLNDDFQTKINLYFIRENPLELKNELDNIIT